MIARQLDGLRTRLADVPAIHLAHQTCTYGQLGEAAEWLTRRLAHLAGQAVGVCVRDFSQRLALLAALDRLGARAVLFPNTAPAELVRIASQEMDFTETLSDESLDNHLDDGQSYRALSQDVSITEAQRSAGQILLFTSGTSGPPKLVHHDWKSLSAAVQDVPAYRGRRWLLAYDPCSFAGIQVWLQSLFTGGTLSVPAAGDSGEMVAALVGDRVELVSATPTWWRMLLGAAARTELAKCSLEHITLGGEAVDQGILDALRAAFPRATIRHIYASTEMGVVFSVHDGKAGFPAEFLDAAPAHCQLRIADDGQLEIRTTRAMLEFDPASQWFSTGDLVERRGDRVWFVGRKSGAINVGGSKVYPEEVENVIRLVPGVGEARVFGRASAVTGEIVCAEVQPLGTADPSALQAAILTVCRQKLPKHKVPALVRFSHALALTESGKLARAGD